MRAEAPPRLSANPIVRVASDLLSERAARGTFPPGPADFDFQRTRVMARDPLSILLPLYREYGPIFSVRLLHSRVVFMLGPAANHFILVEHPEYFHWREGSFGDLIPLLGDGLLTIDGAYHDEARRIMMPAFHREQIMAATEVMFEEGEAALARWRPGETIDIYHWMRNVAMRIAMRALLGLDPDDRGQGAEAAEHFERALSYYGIDFHKRLLRGPGSPWRSMQRSRARLDEIVHGEIRKRRAEPEPRRDILGMLIAARDDSGEGFSDREIRDQVMTLMFAGHDTSTSTLTFLMYELARNRSARERVVAELDEVLGGRRPDPMQLERELPELGMAIDETLRLYPPAWIGPRRAVHDFEFGGHTVKAGTYVNYSSWASHRLPEVFPDPEAFDPRRFTPERKAALPRGAYVPFGGGSRICIGKRFGQTEVKALATLILQRFRLEHVPGHTMRIRQMPTLSPDGGLPMVVRARED
ncbi:MAG TPA: cytochrome P450 [Solirubrobacterales bacterium]